MTSLGSNSRGVASPIILILACTALSLLAGEYFEGFDAPGKPPARDGIHWGYADELTPVDGWKGIIPGDGYAHVCVNAAALAKKPAKVNPFPFQTLSFGPFTPGHRISMRAKNTAIPGVACSLFTYRERSGVHEIDIEIVSEDTLSAGAGHPTGSDGGWSDIRLNTWADAHEGKTGILKPSRSIRHPVQDAEGNNVSLKDGKFHTFTIEWQTDSVSFYIDNVPQGVIRDVVPEPSSQVILGMRRIPWAAKVDWSGRETMLIDWVDVEELK